MCDPEQVKWMEELIYFKRRYLELNMSMFDFRNYSNLTSTFIIPQGYLAAHGGHATTSPVMNKGECVSAAFRFLCICATSLFSYIKIGYTVYHLY